MPALKMWTCSIAEVMYLLIALSYPVGFILVIIGRSDLFTEHTTLAILPVLGKRRSISDLLRVWSLIYGGNMLGAALFSVLFVNFVDMTVRLDGEVVVYYGHKLMEDNGSGQFVGAIFAGWLMGLLGWMVTSAGETISRIAVVALITFVIGLGGLSHCIAGAVGVFSALFNGDTAISVWAGLKFLFLATLGNIVGGTIFVGILKYSYVSSD